MFNAKTFIIKKSLQGEINITHYVEPGSTDIFTFLYIKKSENSY